MTTLKYMSPFDSLLVFAYIAATVWFVVWIIKKRNNLTWRNRGVQAAYYIAYVIRDGKEILLWDETRASSPPKRGVVYNKICEHFELTGEGDYRIYMAIDERGKGSYQRRLNLYDYGERQFVLSEGKNRTHIKVCDRVANLLNFDDTYTVERPYTLDMYKLPFEGDPPEREWCNTYDDIPRLGMPQRDRNQLYPAGFREMCKTEEHLAKCRAPKALVSKPEES